MSYNFDSLFDKSPPPDILHSMLHCPFLNTTLVVFTSAKLS